MRINISKVGKRYIVTDDANIRLLDTGLKGKEVWQHYFDVRHEQACEGKETPDEPNNCIKHAVSNSGCPTCGKLNYPYCSNGWHLDPANFR